MKRATIHRKYAPDRGYCEVFTFPDSVAKDEIEVMLVRPGDSGVCLKLSLSELKAAIEEVTS